MAPATDFASLIRSLVHDDFDTHRRLSAQLDEAQGWPGYAEYLAAAFVQAVERRFGAQRDAASIVWFIAAVRENFDGTGRDIDPVAAETLIRAVFGEADASSIDGGTMGKLETVLLYQLLADEDLSDQQLDEFLVEVARTASAQ